MKNLVRIVAGALCCAGMIYLSNCGPKPSGQANQNPPNCDSLCDSLESAELAKLAIMDAAIKYKGIHSWKRNKFYTLCLSVNLKNNDERVEVTIYRKKVVVLQMILVNGDQKFMLHHRKAGFTPEISVRFRHKDNTMNDADVNDDPGGTGACGAIQSVTDRLKSTSVQTSTVLVTIDEKD